MNAPRVWRFQGGLEVEVAGGAETIGGNAVIVRRLGEPILGLDYGLNYSAFSLYFDYPHTIPKTFEELRAAGAIADPARFAGVRALLISHLHSDHIKYIPALIELGGIDELHLFLPSKELFLVRMRYINRRRRKAAWWLTPTDVLEDVTKYVEDGKIVLHDVRELLKDGGREYFNEKAEVVPIAVDHSAQPAFGFQIDLRDEGGGETTIYYTGDYRFLEQRCHDCPLRDSCPLRKLREGFDLFDDVYHEKHPDVLISEGTQLTRTLVEPTGERNLRYMLANRVLPWIEGAVFLLSSPSDLSRLFTVVGALGEGNIDRKVVVTDLYLTAIIDRLAKVAPGSWLDYFRFTQPKRDEDLEDMEIGPEITSRKIDFEDVVSDPDLYIVHVAPYRATSFFQDMFRENIVIPGHVIHTASEPHDESGEQELERTVRWAALLRLQVSHQHVSGHAAPWDIERVIDAMRPRVLIPIHTREPAALLSMLPEPSERPEFVINGSLLSEN